MPDIASVLLITSVLFIIAVVLLTIALMRMRGMTRRLQEALEDFARVRRRTVDLLHGWGKTEWERTISDPRGGTFTLLEVCQLVTRHEMAHIAQIRNLTVLLPDPEDLGPLQPQDVTP